MMRIGIVVLLASLAAGCGRERSEAPAAFEQKAAAPKPADESRRLPKENLIDTRVVDSEIMGKSFMPGGTVGRYRRGKAEYEMFVAKAASPTDAAIALGEWKRALPDARLVPAFGAYYGKDGERPMFVFTKGSWLAGVAGLNEKAADLPARELASRLSFTD